MDKKDKNLIDFAEFVATKFQSNRDGWVYSRKVDGLKHVRYESDSTGYNHWTKRLSRALPIKRNLRSSFFGNEKMNLREKFIHAKINAEVALRKDDNRPDGQINGNLTFWEEDGEYIALFQPRVGVKVLEFIKADPENPYARAILDEMRACSELSWPSKEGASEEDDSEEDKDEELEDELDSEDDEDPAV